MERGSILCGIIYLSRSSPCLNPVVNLPESIEVTCPLSTRKDDNDDGRNRGGTSARLNDARVDAFDVSCSHEPASNSQSTRAARSVSHFTHACISVLLNVLTLFSPYMLSM